MAGSCLSELSGVFLAPLPTTTSVSRLEQGPLIAFGGLSVGRIGFGDSVLVELGTDHIGQRPRCRIKGRLPARWTPSRTRRQRIEQQCGVAVIAVPDFELLALRKAERQQNELICARWYRH
jgi:hypothetical protein